MGIKWTWALHINTNARMNETHGESVRRRPNPFEHGRRTRIAVSAVCSLKKKHALTHSAQHTTTTLSRRMCVFPVTLINSHTIGDDRSSRTPAEFGVAKTLSAHTHMVNFNPLLFYRTRNLRPPKTNIDEN